MGTVSRTLVTILASSLILDCATWKCPPDSQPTLIPNGKYSPEGKVITAAGMSIYEVGPNNSSPILIGISDIFGIGPNTNNMQVCDVLAESGFKVVLPDFFHGEPWTTKRGDPNKYTNPNYDAFLEKFTWENSIRDDLRNLIDHYKRIGFVKFGIFGYKFGARQTLFASEEFSDTFLVGGQFSPSPGFTDDARQIKIPTAIFEDMLMTFPPVLDVADYCKIVTSNLGEGSCVGKHYNNTECCGFLGGAEADWTKPENTEKAADALMIFEQFLCSKFLN